MSGHNAYDREQSQKLKEHPEAVISRQSHVDVLVDLLRDIKAWDIEQASENAVNGNGVNMALPDGLRQRLQLAIDGNPMTVTECGGYKRVGWGDKNNRTSPWATCPGCSDCKE